MRNQRCLLRLNLQPLLSIDTCAQVNPRVTTFEIPDSIFELTKELSERGLSTKGLRSVLQERLLVAKRQEDVATHDERPAYERLMRDFC